jgi:hypothetical protein
MVLRLILLVTVVIGLVGVFGGLIPSGDMLGIVQSLPAPLITVAYAGEINQLSTLVDEFLELRENRNSKNAQDMAEKLDTKINNLQLVKMFCDEEISTLELVFENNPYKKLQKICPELKNISLPKAAQLFSQI